MFWRFGGYNVSTIDTILDKESFQLEELLDESDLIQELKQHNPKLVEYLREQHILEKLLQYVVAPKLEAVAVPDDDEEEEQEDDEIGKPPVFPTTRSRSSSRATDPSGQEENEKKRNRYAFVAAEILSSDNYSIHEALMESKPLLRNFWQFLKRPTPLDPLQASYFTKVNESLFDKKTEEMLDLLKSFEGAISDILRHVDCPMIMDLLLKIISLERTESGQGVVEWLYTQSVMPTLLSFLGPEHSWATQTSAADFIKAIITVSANASQNEQTCIGPNELTRQLVSRPCVEQLIQYMLGGGNPLTCGVGIIIEVIRKNNSDYDPEGVDANAPPSCRDPIYLGTLLRLFADHVPDFMNLIMKAPAQKERLSSTFGDRIEPLGFDRFKTCELMAELLHCSNMGLLNEVGSEQFIAARDAQRQRLRDEGRLIPARGIDDTPSSTEDLTMRTSQSSPAEERRKLEVMNISADDDGFEEVSHGAEEDTSDDVLELPDAPNQAPSFSLLDKDEADFVDEPLSSPRLNFKELDTEETVQSPPAYEDPDLVVAPLSPTKKAAQLSTSQGQESAAKPVTDEKAPQAADKTKEISNEELPPLKTESTIKAPEAADVLSPHPGDTPAPLFSGSAPPKPATDVAERSTEAITESKDKAGQTAEPSPAKAEAPEEAPANANANETTGDISIVSAPVGDSTTTGDGPSTTPQPVVGDYLKMQFVRQEVVPTILRFFFKYPWNNFLHNVVYDIVQQVFNGPMDRGFNPTLAISLFEAADITNQIINGQLASERSQAQHKTRMGYMGHLTLIAEEVVKFTERHPPELLSEVVLEKVMAQDWINYVEGALAETRERDNAILGGIRPEVAMSNRAAQSGLVGVGLNGLSSIGLGGNNSNTLAEAGLGGGSDLGDGSGVGASPFGISSGTMMSGFGSSSDEDEDEEQESEEDVNNEVGEDFVSVQYFLPSGLLDPPEDRSGITEVPWGHGDSLRGVSGRFRARGESSDSEGSDYGEEEHESDDQTNSPNTSAFDEDEEAYNQALGFGDFRQHGSVAGGVPDDAGSRDPQYDHVLDNWNGPNPCTDDDKALSLFIQSMIDARTRGLDDDAMDTEE
ncbi:SIT4 phosphatase-associated protein-domain-containing protein [Triangularia verruculosa]|uniref:SIT4 phosphatase-associated protein-domain-containing protein n=1 Tax=Triangularia verruculosa TaxID=2587418 RepID=A0AAN6XC50_9PEZI|nr:SIT4 phosphatase-associated protein-domain-containing protein [Triangularia verruculosa]